MMEYVMASFVILLGLCALGMAFTLLGLGFVMLFELVCDLRAKRSP